MKTETAKILQRKKKVILENWIKNQLENDGLREDLISNEEQRGQSEELLDSLLENVNDTNLADATSRDFDKVMDILSGISMSRAKQGFTPRETGAYLFGLKEALLHTLASEISDQTILFAESMKITRLM